MIAHKRLVILIFLIVLLSLTVIGLISASANIRQKLSTVPLLTEALNITTTSPGQRPASSTDNKLLYIRPIEDSTASEAAKEYVNKYSAYFKPESPEVVAGFYLKQISTNSAERQLYIYGTLTSWDVVTDILTVKIDYGLVELKSDPAGVFNHPKSSNQLISPDGTKIFIGKSVTFWVQLRDNILYTDRLAITTYD